MKVLAKIDILKELKIFRKIWRKENGEKDSISYRRIKWYGKGICVGIGRERL